MIRISDLVNARLIKDYSRHTNNHCSNLDDRQSTWSRLEGLQSLRRPSMKAGRRYPRSVERKSPCSWALTRGTQKRAVGLFIHRGSAVGEEEPSAEAAEEVDAGAAATATCQRPALATGRIQWTHAMFEND